MSKRVGRTGLFIALVAVFVSAGAIGQEWPAWEPPQKKHAKAPPTLSPGVEGFSTGLSARRVTCRNGATGQTVDIMLRGLAYWDCEAAGLVVNPGDRVKQRIQGLASEVIGGTVVGWEESGPIMALGDGHHDVHAWWSINTFDKGWFYGSAFTVDSDVAHAVGVIDISGITDASTYAFTTGAIGPLCDADCDPDGVGEFVVWRNLDGFYGAMRLDDIDLIDPDIPLAELDATWWFQPDGSPNLADSVVGGTSPVGTLHRVQCQNVTTGQVVNVFPATDSWDCEAAGLIVATGDKVRMIVVGTVG